MENLTCRDDAVENRADDVSALKIMGSDFLRQGIIKS